jgi:hypothetical protein
MFDILEIQGTKREAARREERDFVSVGKVFYNHFFL